MLVLERIIAVIAPHECVDCGTEGNLLCPACRRTLPTIPSRCYRCNRGTTLFCTCRYCHPTSPLFQVFAATAYDGSAKELIHRLKFGRAQAAALDIARVMTRRIPRGVDWLVVHVPTASTRIRARGYDQAQRIAREVARQLGVPYLPMLVREGAQRQLGQSRKTRQQQMRSAFRVIHRASLQGKHVLLIDDVLTTGATCEAAATVLKDAGAARVSAAVFAAA